MRTEVAPSSMATRKSSLIPIDRVSRSTVVRWKPLGKAPSSPATPVPRDPRTTAAWDGDCNSEPNRVSWSYDDNLGVAYPPKFPGPVVDDRNPSQEIIGYKRKSF